MSLTFPQKTANVVATANAHVVAPALGGMGTVWLVRRFVTKAENPASMGGLIGGAVGGLVLNAGVQYGAQAWEARAIAKADEAAA